MWLIGMIFLIASSLLGALNFIVTILHLRAEGLTFMRLPFFVWSQLVTAFLLLLAFPPLQAASVFQLMDRLAGTSFFLPSGLVVGGEQIAAVGGGSPLLWQHLFWFLGHPEVYVLILPGMGIVAEVITNNTRKPLWGYKGMVYSILTLFFLSFFVWAHEREAFRAKMQDRHDEVERAEQRRSNQEDHPDQPKRLARRRRDREGGVRGPTRTRSAARQCRTWAGRPARRAWGA